MRKNNMTLLACMYMAGLVQPKLIRGLEHSDTGINVPDHTELQSTPVPMSKLSLEAQADKIRKAEDKRLRKQAKRLG